jgi:hypothetical protein
MELFCAAAEGGPVIRVKIFFTGFLGIELLEIGLLGRFEIPVP